MQKYGHLANQVADRAFVCEICGESQGFNWSDRHGEGMCNSCGAPYDLLEKPHKLCLKPEWVPVLKRYWNEEKRYMGLGSIMIWDDYPEAAKGRKALNEWIEAHPDLKPQ